jgi:hypothetical protein
MPKIKEDKKGKIESESITFRIERSILGELRSEADQKMESVNTLVNQIIKSYVQWHKPARKAGLGYFSKVLVSQSMDYLTDEQIIQMTEEFCNHHLKDITHMLRSSHTFSSFMDGLCSWLDASGYHFRIDRFNGMDTYVIQFDLGRKYSLYFKTQMKSVFEHFNVQNAEAEMTDNTVILKINV